MPKRLSIALALATLTLTTTAQPLHYNRPADYFEEALVVGNRRLGATVYGGIGHERIALNDITLWTGEPITAKAPRTAHATALAATRDALAREDYAAADTLVNEQQAKEAEYSMPLGTRHITREPSQPTDYTRTLALRDATATTLYSGYSQEVFASAPDSVIVIRISSDRPITLDYVCQLPHERQAILTDVAFGGKQTDDSGFIIDGYAAYAANSWEINGAHDCHFHYDPTRGTHFRTIVYMEHTPSDNPTHWGEATIYIVNTTSFDTFDSDPATSTHYIDDATRILHHALRKGYDAIRADQLSDHRALYDRVQIDLGKTDATLAALPTDQQLRLYSQPDALPNPELEATYLQYSRYLLISCSRTNGVPANLQGLWNEHLMAPWRCDYTTNINLEENYWGAELLNLSELHMPLLTFIKNLSVDGARVANDYYGVTRGWCAGHNSDIWAMANPIGEGIANPQWANWTMGGAWLATHIWEHYLFTGDRQFLTDYYPTLRGAALFCNDWLIERNGELITSPSTSPENMFVTDSGYTGNTLYGGTADLALTRECLLDAIRAAQTLGANDLFIAQAEQTLARLHPYTIAKRGNLLEWYHDWDDADWTHRHQSHLEGLFPGAHITLRGTPTLAQAAARTLENKGDHTTGWSTGWRINLYARLHDSTRAYHTLRTLLRYISPDNYQGPDKQRGGGTYPNLLDAHQPFQIDGNFGGGAGIAEMLIQSYVSNNSNNHVTIELLPATPEQWATGNIKGLCARGGAIVDFNWKNGKVISITITQRPSNEAQTQTNTHYTIIANEQQYDITIAPEQSATIWTLMPLEG